MSNSKKTYIVLGLGIFGSTISKELTKFGQDVIALDKDMSCVERMSELVAHAVCCDFTDQDQLRAIGAGDADAAIVATGSHLEESILAIMNLKELGVPYVLAKAKNRKYGDIMLKIGADKIVLPEKEMGIRMAKALLAWNIVELVDIDKDYSIMEIKAPTSWVNKSLLQLNIRSKLGINVLGIRNGDNQHLSINPNPNYLIQDTDQLLVVADKDIFNHFEELERVRG